MRSRSIQALVAAGICCALAIPGVATADHHAATTVTIKGSGDIYGYVSSPAPKKCAKDRKIKVYKQKGSTQKPSTDKVVASDLASKSGDRYMWSVGQPGVNGKIYARAGKTPDCKADSSKTITV
jgi:hypothetical protein